MRVLGRVPALPLTAVWLLVAACGASITPGPSAGPSAGAATPAPVVVVLGIYSGRADPEWTLTAAQAATLSAMLAGLTQVMEDPPAGGLGYHGFTIGLPGGPLVAFRGAIAPPGEAPRRTMVDPSRGVERFLLDTGRAHLADAEIPEVERVLAGA